MPEETLSVAEAGRRLPDLVERALRFHESTLLTDNGQPVARVVPAELNESVAHQLAELFRTRPRLGSDEAAIFETDLLESREQLQVPGNPWE
jgi:prevent-host-death family protein